MELTFALMICAWFAIHEIVDAADDDAISSLPASTFAPPAISNLNNEILDQRVIDLLEEGLTINMFESFMFDHSTANKLRFRIASIRELYSAYEGYKTFNEPCNVATMNRLSRATKKAKLLKNETLKRVLDHLLRQRSAEVYMTTCIDDLDRLARELYSSDEVAQQLMTQLTTNLATKIPSRMIYSNVQQYFDSSRPENKYLRSVMEPEKYEPVCDRTNNNPRVQHSMFLLSNILIPDTIFRPKSLVDRLNGQIDDDNGPDTIKLLSLALFCQSLNV